MIFIELLIVFSLVLLNGALAMSELAIASSRQTRLRAMVQQHVKGARRALALASDPGRFLATVQIGITLIGIIAGAFSGVTIADRLANWFETQGVTPAIAEPLAFGLVITGITYISLIFGEIVPKQIALRAPEQIACRVAPATANLAQVSAPLVWVLNRSAKTVLSLLGQTSPVESAVTDAEIHSLIAEAESAGVIGGMPIKENPVQHLSLQAPERRRERRLVEGELQRLIEAARSTRSCLILPIILFAIETGMRRGEILAMRWDHLQEAHRALLVPISKNGQPRVIPLSRPGLTLLSTLDRTSERVFPIASNAFRLAWDRLRARARLDDLNFHDLRHEAISRLFEKGLSPPEAALVSGHNDMRMLFRYTHPQREVILVKLDKGMVIE